MQELEDPPISEATAGLLRTDTLAESVLVLLALTVVQRMVGFGRAVLFCRWMDAEALGQWDMAFSFLMVAAPLAVFSLSAAFRRYVEYYRRMSQLRTLVWRTAVFHVVCGSVAVTVVWSCRGWFSEIVFGSPGHERMVALLAVSLVPIVAYHFFIELLTALRKVRFISGLQLVQSAGFAVLGIALLLGIGGHRLAMSQAAGMVIAYAAASALVSLFAIGWLVRSWSALPQAGPPPGQRQLWTKLMPFAVGVWVTTLLTSLFEVADRYMIIHSSAFSQDEALALVGQYHSSRLVPLLLVSVAAMFGTVVAPHLSHDWEHGRRDRVCRRLNLYLKLSLFVMSAAAVAVLFAAPVLFGVALKGKFAGGLAVLPWTLVYCIWFGANAIAQNYLWCAEKTRLASYALLAGLIANVGLNLLLLPRLGLLGAVLATVAANGIALLLIIALSHRHGYRIDRGTWVALALPLALCLGPWIALVVLSAVAVDAAYHDRLLSAEEKEKLAEGLLPYRRRFRDLRVAFRSVE